MKSKEVDGVIVELAGLAPAHDPAQHCSQCGCVIEPDGSVKDCPWQCDRVISSSAGDDFKELDFSTEVITQYDLDNALQQALEECLDDGC